MKHIAIATALTLSTLASGAYASAPKHEIRAVWLTTNSNLDWPSVSYRTNPSAQKAELTQILDRLQDANFNTIIFQAQVKGDVCWDSSYQPSMKEVTGDGATQMKYDVAAYVIEECHKRNMEVHAWIVPYRIGTASEASRYKNNPKSHLYYTHPEWCRNYNNSYYLDPGLPEVRAYLLDLYRELITNYDFDGCSFDYTRYPANSGFPDEDTYARYNPDNLNLGDWRRQNINTFIAEFYQMAKEINPDFKVGAAPIGTYKTIPGYGNMTAYDVYQDACQWMQSGNHDLLIPQMYWNERYGFSAHMETWTANAAGRTLAVGLAPYKMNDGTNDWEVSVVLDQIEKVRAKDGMSGVCFFRTEHVIGDYERYQSLYSELMNNYFRYPAHFPTMAHLGVTQPSKPTGVTQEYVNGEYQISWDANDDSDNVRYYSVYRTNGPSVDTENLDNVVAFKVNGTSYTYRSNNPDLKFAITAFDKGYYESAPAIAVNSGVEAINDRLSAVRYNNQRLMVDGDRELDHVDIINLSGQTMKAVPACGSSVAIECGLMPRGLYIARVKYADGGMSITKFVR